MNSILYIYRQTWINKFKKALHRPVVLISTILICGYGVFAIWGLGNFALQMKVNTTENLGIFLSIAIFYLIPGNLISYVSRKGLIFKNSDVHFVFPTPLEPKKVLLMAAFKSFLGNFVIGIAVVILGIWFFHASVLRMLGFFLLFSVTQNILEGAMIILCYGGDYLTPKVSGVLKICMRAMMLVFAAVAVALLIQKGLHIEVIQEYLKMPMIQLLPVVGWNIAVIQLIFGGATTVNLIGTVLCAVTTITLAIWAWKMPCDGGFYEDAISFADEYAERIERAKKGNVFGQKDKKLKKNVSIEYKGKRAKAIFYKQILEYKKKRFFIFNIQTLISLIVGIGVVVAVCFGVCDDIDGVNRVFILPGVGAYLRLLKSSSVGRWRAELENPYTFLIPDTGFKKLWYATLVEHVRHTIDAVLIMVPGAIALHLSPLALILSLAFYVCLCADQLYMHVISECLIGKMLGELMGGVVRGLLQLAVLGIGIGVGAMLGIIVDPILGFAVMIMITAALTLAGMFAASGFFEKMEID